MDPSYLPWYKFIRSYVHTWCFVDALPSLVFEDHDESFTYCLHFDKLGFSWESAQEYCHKEKATVGQPPFPEFLMERLMEAIPNKADDIWLYGGTQSPPFDCKTFKQDCEHVS